MTGTSTNRTDPLTLVAAYAPDSDWPASERRDLLVEVLRRADAEPERLDVARRDRRDRRRRLAAFAAAGVLTVAGGGAAAAATGVLPDATYDWMLGSHGHAPVADQLDPSTARKVFVVDGPHGNEFAGWTAENGKGWLCVTAVFEPKGSDHSPYAGGALTTGGQCSDGPPSHGLFANGAGTTWGLASDDRVDFVWEAGAAVRAELQVSTGAVYPVSVQDGWLGGWYDLDQVPRGASATIVAYGADGSVLGRFSAQGQFGCDDPAGC